MRAQTMLPWWMAVLLSLFLSARFLAAQETNEIEQLRKQLKDAIETNQKAAEQHRKAIEELQRRLEALEQKQGQPGAAAQGVPATNATIATNVPAAAATTTTGINTNVPTAAPWTPSQPIPLVKAGQAYMNISFDALMDFGWSTAHDVSRELNLGDHDPSQRGFSMRNAEIALDGAVDPYFKAFANIVLKLDNNGDTDIELEETYAQTTSLPGNLQVKAGQFFAAFGRQNSQHPHQWAFVDQSLILTRTFGPDGLRNLGAQGSWLMPLPFYSEAFLGVFNGQGETAFSFRNRGQEDAAGVERLHGRATLDRELSGPGELLFVPHLATSFDLTAQQTLLAGVSAAFGPNATGQHTDTQIYGVDLFWKWKPANAHQGYPFVSFQTEALYQSFDAGADAGAGLPAETLHDYGFYSQVLWGFHTRWVAGLRGEYVTGNDGAADSTDVFRGDRTRISPNLTWYLSEFSKLRLQYNYDHGDRFGEEHSVWLQLEVLLGAHGAHKF